MNTEREKPLAAGVSSGSEMMREDAARAMTSALCDFAMRWKVDGDYMRCVGCKRPQIASSYLPFRHAPDCVITDNRPWDEFMRILAPIPAAQVTDAMVEAACVAMVNAYEMPPEEWPSGWAGAATVRAVMRAAITAALATGQEATP